MPTLTDIWNWLPTFRAVAESDTIAEAAARLHVTPPAISRTIRNLEDALGYDVFNRSGRKLVLNTAGVRLLESVRSAMESTEEALRLITSDLPSGPIRVATLGVLTDHFVLPALLDLCEEFPSLVPRLVTLSTAEAHRHVASGQLDVAFSYEALATDELITEQLGVTSASIYCGQAHPLWNHPRPCLEEICAHPFSVPAVGDTGTVRDGWPVEVDRVVGMRITNLTTNVAVCRSGRFLTVLPDAAALPYLVAGELRRFEVDIVRPIEIFATFRRTERAASAVYRLIASVTDVVRRIEAEVMATR